MGLFSGIGKAIGSVVGDITGAGAAADAAGSAARLQARSAEQGIQEQRRQFDKLVELMAPFVEGGTKAFGAQGALLGLEGPEAQAEAIAGLEKSPEFLALVDQEEEAILQNASATGGLRGGNIQEVLRDFRPQLLTQLINDRFNRLGQLSQFGQASAAGQGAAGMQSASNVGNLLAQRGAALAGGKLARGGELRTAINDAIGIGKTIAGFF